MPGEVVDAGATPEVVPAPPVPVVVEGAGVVLPVVEPVAVETVPPIQPLALFVCVDSERGGIEFNVSYRLQKQARMQKGQLRRRL